MTSIREGHRTPETPGSGRPNIEALKRQILLNCLTSDARYAGHYSICGLALRLRDLYKWEKGIEPWIEQDPAKVLEWIGEREEAWEDLVEKDLSPIEMGGRSYDPFDTEGVNRILIPSGLFYGAGYVHGLKPSFFLAYIEEKRSIHGHPIYILGRELARDLLTIPALSQGDAVIIRKQSAKLYLWDQIFYVTKSGRKALDFGLRGYGVTASSHQEVRPHLERILTQEMETFVRHEIGEMEDRVFDRGTWRELIATFPHSPIELLARVVKDHLADTNPWGALSYILDERKAGSLGFYMAFAGHFKKLLFPELTEAFEAFSGRGEWGVLAGAAELSKVKARRLAGEICRIYQEGKGRGDMKWAGEKLEEELLRPLGILKEKMGDAGAVDE
jgi:hypothetical protein